MSKILFYIDYLKRCHKGLTDLSRQGNGNLMYLWYDFVKCSLIHGSIIKHYTRGRFYTLKGCERKKSLTYNVNNKVTVGSRAIKCGSKDAVVDNIGNGKRGVIIGIKRDGSLCDSGFFENGEETENHNNVIFAGKKINHFHRVVDAAISLHSNLDKCKIVGWDIALDSNNDPVLIEGNVIYPGISLEQMCSGPIFSNRTDEVVEYVYEYQ